MDNSCKSEKIIIRTPEKEDFARVKAICEDRFGEGYISEKDFLNWITDYKYCKVAVSDDKVVGIVYLMPEDKETLAKALKLDKNFVESVSNGKRVIHSRCAAIDKAYEHRGISDILHREIFANINSGDFGAIFAPAWTYQGFTPMAKLLNKYGFEFIGEKENLWYGMEGYKCIICGGKCKCKAAVYMKKI